MRDLEDAFAHVIFGAMSLLLGSLAISAVAFTILWIGCAIGFNNIICSN